MDASKIDEKIQSNALSNIALGLSCNHQTILNFIHGVSTQHCNFRLILAWNLLHLFSFFFRKVCIMNVGSLLFREFDQIYTPLSKRMLRFSWLRRVKSRFYLPFPAFLFFLSFFFVFSTPQILGHT